MLKSCFLTISARYNGWTKRCVISHESAIAVDGTGALQYSLGINYKQAISSQGAAWQWKSTTTRTLCTEQKIY
jgi:hypothetical protein